MTLNDYTKNYTELNANRAGSKCMYWNLPDQGFSKSQKLLSQICDRTGVNLTLILLTNIINKISASYEKKY